jgi:cold-inducible RNA-binding protein
LEGLFHPLGELREVFLPTDRHTGQPRGFAFVDFVDEAAAAAAIESLHGYELQGRALRVNEAEPRPQTSGFGANGQPSRSGFDTRRRSKPRGSRKNARARKRSL